MDPEPERELGLIDLMLESLRRPQPLAMIEKRGV
jgi:hypothetical protein